MFISDIKEGSYGKMRAHLRGRNFESLKAIRDHLEVYYLKEEEEKDTFALKSRTLQKLHRFYILALELH